MTERVFRKQFVLMWVGYTVTAIVVSRVLLISGLGLERQRILYQVIWLGTVVGAIVLYRRGSVTDHAVREQILGNAQGESKSTWRLVSAVVLLGLLAAVLGLGIWDVRSEWWGVVVAMIGGLGFNFLLMRSCFLSIRNAHLRRMQAKGQEANSQGE
jgi:hypothetical protein